MAILNIGHSLKSSSLVQLEAEMPFSAIPPLQNNKKSGNGSEMVGVSLCW